MTTLNLQVGASSDDVHQAGGGNVTLTGTTISVGTTTEWAGFRFQNVTIPPGSIINTASIQVKVFSTTFDDPNVDIYGEDVDDASTFVASNNNISNRTRTTAKTTWNNTGIGSGFRTSPDIAAVIQEIIDRAGWLSGNDLNIILDGLASSSFVFYSYDNAAADAPKLDIDYTAPASGMSRPIRLQQVKQIAIQHLRI